MGWVVSPRVLSVLVLIVCASAVRHEKQKWSVHGGQYVPEDEACDDTTEEPDYSEPPYDEDDEMNVEVVVESDSDQEEFGQDVGPGSIRGIPGVDYPDLSEIPLTKFSCAEQKYIPGFYADLETACQVFHVCYQHRRESFLCPVGTIFNQPILTCDYWYSANCSLSPLYYDVNAPLAKQGEKLEPVDPEVEDLVSASVDEIPEEAEPTYEPVITTTEPRMVPAKPQVKIPSLPAKVTLKYVEPKIVSEPSVKYLVDPALKTKPAKAIKTPEIAILKSFLPVKAKITKLAKATLKPVSLALAKATLPIIKPPVLPKPVYTPVMKSPLLPKIKYVTPVKSFKQYPLKPVLMPKPVIKIPVVAKIVRKPTLKALKAPVKAAVVYPLVSVLTKKQLALSYLKLLKLKKLAKPLFGWKYL